MLVLKLRPDDYVVIEIPPSDQPRTVVVGLVDMRSGSARLGLDGPEEIDFTRSTSSQMIAEYAQRGQKVPAFNEDCTQL